MKVAAPNCSRHWMDAVDSDGRRQAGATGIMLAHGQMTVAAPTVTRAAKLLEKMWAGRQNRSDQ
jgi:hypothetical protein